MNTKSAVTRVISKVNVRDVGINEEEFSANIIESPTVNGLYLGWVRKDTQKWEPLAKLTIVEGGYTAQYTSNHEEISALYPGYKDLLIWSELDVVNRDFPHIFRNRMPLLRNDVKNDCEFLKLDYPQIDKIAYVSRYGGRICGDKFSICPSIEPDASGNYIFYCALSGVEERQEPRKIWQQIRDRSGKFSLIKAEDKYCLEFEGVILGYLEQYFELIDGEIIQIEIINFTDPSKRQGHSVLLKIIIHGKNAYAHRLFQDI
ncbi:hypothetical protein [Chamaesiphon minutus]|uniref:Uncharacterized protein n=1 Tax=Chamaesiphon minutus (strain ATCC 27169 / PCC 6605) TaxID=1173020 RepID=K9UE92_CHAP6|nr:hypothetical protein [Chamaesiphon minutus]AFY92741.1 hypothetical protein Cha6605_1589 [Chamaesiphon minutus PCC 6605]